MPTMDEYAEAPSAERRAPEAPRAHPWRSRRRPPRPERGHARPTSRPEAFLSADTHACPVDARGNPRHAGPYHDRRLRDGDGGPRRQPPGPAQARARGTRV